MHRLVLLLTLTLTAQTAQAADDGTDMTDLLPVLDTICLPTLQGGGIAAAEAAGAKLGFAPDGSDALGHKQMRRTGIDLAVASTGCSVTIDMASPWAFDHMNTNLPAWMAAHFGAVAEDRPHTIAQDRFHSVLTANAVLMISDRVHDRDGTHRVGVFLAVKPTP